MIQIRGVDVDGTLLRELRRGACFGERALLFSEPRSAKVGNGGNYGKTMYHPDVMLLDSGSSCFVNL